MRTHFFQYSFTRSCAFAGHFCKTRLISYSLILYSSAKKSDKYFCKCTHCMDIYILILFEGVSFKSVHRIHGHLELIGRREYSSTISSSLGSSPGNDLPASAGILEQFMVTRNRVGTRGTGLSYRPARLCSQCWNFRIIYGGKEQSCRTGPPAYVAWRAGTITLFLLGS
jgi:hypothetical protein